MITALLALTFPAFAEDAEDGSPIEASFNGDVKAFQTMIFPYEDPPLGFPDQMSGQGIVDVRGKLVVESEAVKFVAHHAVTSIAGSSASALGSSTGLVFGTPETVKLSYSEGSSDLTLRGRTDRLYVKTGGKGWDVTLGRQPISFGSGMFYTPMDLVNPFTPATIDQEYKPGVDALRVDGYLGMTGNVSLVTAYAGDWDVPGMVFAGYGPGTVGVTDIGGFAGLIHGDIVGGLSTVTSVGAFGFHGDVTVTVPAEDAAEDSPFVRAVAGTMVRPTGTTTVTGELYLQSLGGASPDQYLQAATSDRFGRGELWLMGRYYAGLAVAQEIAPTLNGSVAVMANLADPSAFIAPSLAWSVAANADVAFGGFVGVGARPDVDQAALAEALASTPPDEAALYDAFGVQSEFGTYPATAFVQLKAYF